MTAKPEDLILELRLLALCPNCGITPVKAADLLEELLAEIKYLQIEARTSNMGWEGLRAERDEARAELDSEMDHSQDLAKRVERLLAQNRRLREEFERIRDCAPSDSEGHPSWASGIARRALENQP